MNPDKPDQNPAGTWTPGAYFTLATLAFLALMKYHGADYQNAFYTSLANPGAFANDIYLAGAIHKKATIFYDLAAFLHLHLENDFVSFALYAGFAALAVGFSYKFFRRLQGADNPALALLAVLLSSFLVSKFIFASQPSVLENVSSGPTMAAHALGFGVLYFLLARKIFTASLLMALVFAFTIKGTFILLPAAGLYILLNREIKNSSLVFLLIPTAYVIYKAVTSSLGPFSSEELSALTDIAMAREEEEGSFNYQTFSALFLFAATFAAFPLIIKRFENISLRALCWSFYIATLGLFIGGMLYTTIGYKIFPQPMLVLIGAPRAVKFYTFLFSALSFVLILRTDKLTWYEKIAAAFSFVLLKATPAGILFSALILFIGVGVPRLMHRFSRMDIADLPVVRTIAVPLARTPLSILMTGILLAFVIVRAPASYVGPLKFEPLAYRYYGIWSQRIGADENTWKAYREIRNMPGDFVLIAYYYPKGGNRELKVENHFNYYALKSRFYGDVAYFYFNLTGAREALKRRDILNDLTDLLRAGTPLPAKLVASLARRHVKVMAPQKLDALFPAGLPRQRIRDFVLLTFGGK